MEMNLLMITKQRCWCLPVRGEIVVRAHSIMSEETLCPVFSGFYKRKDTSQRWEKNNTYHCLCFLYVYTVNLAFMQTLINKHNNLCADVSMWSVPCIPVYSPICTQTASVNVRSLHLDFWTQRFWHTTLKHQISPNSKVEPKRRTSPSKAKTYSMSQARFCPFAVWPLEFYASQAMWMQFPQWNW